MTFASWITVSRLLAVPILLFCLRLSTTANLTPSDNIRWICVAVFDEAGVIASTLSGKYDLAWEEIVGARTYTKVQKEANKVQVRVLL